MHLNASLAGAGRHPGGLQAQFITFIFPRTRNKYSTLPIWGTWEYWNSTRAHSDLWGCGMMVRVMLKKWPQGFRHPQGAGDVYTALNQMRDNVSAIPI